MAESKGIVIFGEITEGKLTPIATEILGCGRKLSDDLKEELICVLIGNQLGDLPQKAFSLHHLEFRTLFAPL